MDSNKIKQGDVYSGKEYGIDTENPEGMDVEDYEGYEEFGMEGEFAGEEGIPAGGGDIYSEIDELTAFARSQGASAELLGILEAKRGQALKGASLSPEKREALIETIRAELGGLQEKILAEVETAPAREALKNEIQELRNELENTVKDEDQKESVEKDIKAAEEALGKSDLEGAQESLEEAKNELEVIIEENPPFAKRMHQQFSDAGIKASEKDIEQALADSGLTEEEISALRLPIDGEKSKALLEFFKKVSPHFAELFAEDPYGKYAMDELSILLKATLDLKSAPTKEDLATFVEPYIEVKWNVGEIRKGLSPYHEGEKKTVLDLLDKAVLTGNTDELHKLIWSGHNDVDRSHHVWNDVIRNILSSIYEAADRNPQLLERYLKLIPKQILQDFRDVVIAHSGELTEKHAGDLFNSQETHDILDWAIAGGEPPAILSGAPTTPAS